MERPSLLNYLAFQALNSIKKKKTFGGEYVVFGEYLEQSQLSFEIGSALGCLYRENIESFAILISEEGMQKSVVNYLELSAIERRKECKPEYKNWFEFFFGTEALAITKRFQDIKLIPDGEWFNPEVYKSKVPFKVAMTPLPTLFAEGIAFGYTFPIFIEKLFSFVQDIKEWDFAYKAGLDIGSKPPEAISLEAMQTEAKNAIKPFAEKYYPELISVLNLR